MCVYQVQCSFITCVDVYVTTAVIRRQNCALSTEFLMLFLIPTPSFSSTNPYLVATPKPIP